MFVVFRIPFNPQTQYSLFCHFATIRDVLVRCFWPVLMLPTARGKRECSAERQRRQSGDKLAVRGAYIADSHHGTLRAPIILKPGDNRPCKIIENDHVVIIRNNEKYDITGKKL